MVDAAALINMLLIGGVAWFFGLMLGLLYHRMTVTEIKAKLRKFEKECTCKK